MDTRPACGQLEKMITAYLEQPRELDEHVTGFIESSLGLNRAEDLCALFRDHSLSEGAAVLDLILFPSLTLQLAIEPVLPDQGLAKEQISGLIKRLARRGARIAIAMPGADPLRVALGPDNLTAFVRRLNLDWANDPAIAGALAALGADRHLRLQVKMRNGRAVFPESSGQFLAGLISRMGTEDHFDHVLDLLLATIGHWPSGASPYEFMAAQRQALTAAISRSGQIEDYRRRAGLEYVLASGIRMPYIDAPEAKRQLELIDRICIAMFGTVALLIA